MYTPIIFEAFQGEYERSLAAYTKSLDGINEYMVGDITYEEEYKVIGDPLKQMVACSCKQFDRIGILCGHALKVLDSMNIKLLPPHYVLKRWTREARSGTIQDSHGRNITENPKMDAMLRFIFMSRKFLNLTHQAANFPKCTMLVDNTLDILGKQIEAKINACTNNSVDPPTISANASPPNDLLYNARLKQKEVQVKSSKRKRTWLDKKHKSRKKRQNKATSHEKKSMVHEAREQRSTDDTHAQVEDDEQLTMDKENNSEAQMTINNFTELLTGPISADLFTKDLF